MTFQIRGTRIAGGWNTRSVRQRRPKSFNVNYKEKRVSKGGFKPGRPSAKPAGNVQGVRQRAAIAMGGKVSKTAPKVEQTKGGFQRKK